MKKLMFIFALLFTLVMATTVHANTILEVNGYDYIFQQAPKSTPNNLMVNSEELENILVADVIYFEGIVTVEKDNNTICINMTDGSATYNGEPMTLTDKPYIEGDVLYLPLNDIAKAFGYTVENINGTTCLTSPTEEYYILNNDYSIETKEITYEDAVTMAINQNSTIDTLEDSVSVVANSINELSEGLYTTPWSHYGINDPTGIFNDTLRAINELESQQEMIPVQKEMLTGTTEYLLMQSMGSLNRNYLDILLLDKVIANLENELIRQQQLYAYGEATKTDVTEAENALEKAKIKREQLILNVQTNQENLKTIIGDQSDQFIVINCDYTPNPLPVDIEAYALSMASQCPTVVMKRENAENAEYKLATAKTSDSPEEREAMQAEVDRAYRELEEEKEQVETNIYNAYAQLESLLLQIEAYEQDLATAQANYNKVCESYEQGYVTYDAVEDAKLAVYSAEVDILKSKQSYWLLEYAFENPFLL